MTLQEFKAKHADIVLEELTPANLDGLAGGASLFYVSLSGRKGPKDGKTILWAGHVLTAGMADSGRQLLILRTTASGRAYLDIVFIAELDPDGRAALFRTKPLDRNDPRNRKTWKQWP